MRFGVIVFPGTWSDLDFEHALGSVLGYKVDRVWHKQTDLSPYDCLVIPGGFSYGDYLRAGAIAKFAPVMTALKQYAADGKPVIGSCNGFQILCEAGLLPGAVVRNEHLEFRCEWTHLKTETTGTTFTSLCTKGQVLRMPIAHGEGRYFADPATLLDLNANGQIAFRYCTPSGETSAEANPNGSVENIAGVTNKERNVLGLMPHPERCCEGILGGTDGRFILESIVASAGLGATT